MQKETVAFDKLPEAVGGGLSDRTGHRVEKDGSGTPIAAI